MNIGRIKNWTSNSAEGLQGSYRSSIVKFPDFSATFQVIKWKFPWPYRNNNPIAQMLEMYTISYGLWQLRNVTYAAMLSAAKASGGVLWAPPAGSGAEPPPKKNRIWCILAWKSDIWCHQFFIFPHFSQKKYSPLTFPWPFKFPDFFQFSLTCMNPGLTVDVLSVAAGTGSSGRRSGQKHHHRRLHRAAAVRYDIWHYDAVRLSRRHPTQVYTVTVTDKPRQLPRRRRSW